MTSESPDRDETNRALKDQLLITEARLRDAEARLRALTDTAGYRFLVRLRALIRRYAPPDTRIGGLVGTTLRGVDMVQVQGWRPFLRRLFRPRSWLPAALTHRDAPVVPLDDQYTRWLRTRKPGASALRRMQAEAGRWQDAPLITAVLLARDGDPSWLAAAVRSVFSQCYPNWEMLVLAPLEQHPTVEAALAARPSGTPVKLLVWPAASEASWLDHAKGSSLAFLAPPAVLREDAFFEAARYLRDYPDTGVLFSDEDALRPDGAHLAPFFKPGWSPELLTSGNYLGAFAVLAPALARDAAARFHDYPGSELYDLLLRATEATTAVAHLPLPLYSRLELPDTGRAALTAAAVNGRRALEAALRRRGAECSVEFNGDDGRYRLRYRIEGSPRVTIIIPTRDRLDLLDTCIRSIEARTTYPNYEILIVDNDSHDLDTLSYFHTTSHRVVPFPGPFLFAKMMNFAAGCAAGDYLVLLNNDTEVISPDWLECMLEHAQRSEIGVVGARLLNLDGSPQHEGIVLGLKGTFAANVSLPHGDLGLRVRDCSAVTAACMMTRKAVFEQLAGFDESLSVVWNDVDFCLRARDAGFRVLYTPYATLYHREGASRGHSHPPEDDRRAAEKWGPPGTARDPFYNPNFDSLRPFQLKLD